MILSNIKTNEQIVDTTDLIDSKIKLWQTNRFACWFSFDLNTDFAKNSDKKSDVYKIFNLKKSSNQLCYIDSLYTDTNFLTKFDLLKVFFLMNKSSLYNLIFFISTIQKNQIIFETSSILNYEVLQINYISAFLQNDLKTSVLNR